MSEFLFHYHRVSPTTWAYLSSLLMIGLFFKFGRFWSVRNLDLFLLILVSPGLLLVHFGRQIRESEQQVADHRVELIGDAPTKESGQGIRPGREMVPESEPSEPTPPDATEDGPSSGGEEVDIGDGDRVDIETEQQASSVYEPSGPSDRYVLGCRTERWGFLWLFVAGGFVLIRLLVDSMMVRRPLLLPNLSVGGLTFIGCSLFIFLVANVITSDSGTESSATEVQTRSNIAGFFQSEEPSDTTGPGHAALNVLPPNDSKVNRGCFSSGNLPRHDIRRILAF